MRRAIIKHVRIVFVLVLLLVIALPVLAQSGGGYDLSWSTTDGGGGSSAGGSYTLNGTAGQPDAGGMTGGGYTLSSGFWFGGEPIVPPGEDLFLPLILR